MPTSPSRGIHAPAPDMTLVAPAGIAGAAPAPAPSGIQPVAPTHTFASGSEPAILTTWTTASDGSPARTLPNPILPGSTVAAHSGTAGPPRTDMSPVPDSEAGDPGAGSARSASLPAASVIAPPLRDRADAPA